VCSVCAGVGRHVLEVCAAGRLCRPHRSGQGKDKRQTYRVPEGQPRRTPLAAALLLLLDVTADVTCSCVACAIIVTLISCLLCRNLVTAVYMLQYNTPEYPPTLRWPIYNCSSFCSYSLSFRIRPSGLFPIRINLEPWIL
jgi:hypothetical protein